ncbi:hypothetical protein NE237_019265 [Protea cynaroides]|uniref:Anaphase-promoting complex subunit 8 n=1 Tax=Protea cynaroides TaxID=273540 RepID=A0A9Q0KBP5_9MAGN|nr:hypothetical protein NE237_019265 [Protea cynaroides]
MDLESVKRLLEKGGDESENAAIDGVSNKAKFFDPFILQGIQVDLIEPGRVVCSMKVPLRLLNSGNFLHGGATASLVDIVGSAAIYTVGAPTTGVSIEINVSYLDAAFINEEIEIEGKVLRVGKAIGVVTVELRKKKTGRIIAQGRHTNYPMKRCELESGKEATKEEEIPKLGQWLGQSVSVLLWFDVQTLELQAKNWFTVLNLASQSSIHKQGARVSGGELEVGLMGSKESCRNELRIAVRQLSERCLYSASKWAAEQLVGIEQDPAKSTPSHTRFQRGSSSIRRRYRTTEISSTPIAGVSYVTTPVPEEDDIVDSDCYLLAKSYFDCREHRRAAHALRDQTGKKAMFLRCYALYLAGEKRKEEEMIELEGPLGKSDAVNRELASVERGVVNDRKSGTIDPFGLYLYGLVLKEKGHEDLARTVLLESVNSYPWNWSAWTELQSLCTTVDILNSLNLKNHWMKDFFLASAYQELRMHGESLLKYEYLQGIFCFSNYLQAQFEGQHEKSVMYFRRALKLNRNYLSAWTLMGHEYVEMKNTPAAIDAYRRAVDINPCDYRAWYGLGQAYEMMSMPYYALYYFRKSVYLQPNDSRLWIAMAQCYETEQLHMLEDAIKCYKRAANCNDREAIALHQLAKLHNELGHSEEAAFYYKKDLERMEAEEREGPNLVEALLFLAAYCKDQKRFEEAEVYCTRLLDYTGPEKETAKSLLRGMRIADSGLPLMDVEHFPS